MTAPLLVDVVKALEGTPTSSLNERPVLFLSAGEPVCDAALAEAADPEGELADLTEFMAERPWLWPDGVRPDAHLRAFGLRRHWPDDDVFAVRHARIPDLVTPRPMRAHDIYVEGGFYFDASGNLRRAPRDV